MAFIPFSEQDAYWMDQALSCASHAASLGEVPVGAVLVTGNRLLAAGWNQSICTRDPTAHAEMVVLRAGAARLHPERLLGTTLYVTLEPCPMCLGAILQARLHRLVFAAYDPKQGAAGSLFHLLQMPLPLPCPDVMGGVREQPARALLQAFFRVKRD